MTMCLFDIDGTLVHAGGAGKAAMEAALGDIFGVTRPTEGISTAGRTDLSIIEDLVSYHGEVCDPETWTQLQEAYLRRLPEHLQQGDGEAIEGIAELLPVLADRNDVTLGLLTGNLVAGARTKLAHFGLDHFFEQAGELWGGFGDLDRCRDDVARRVREQVRQERGSWDPAAVWVIGDTPLDVQCARAIGVRVLAVSTGIFSADQLIACEPDVHLETLEATDRVAKILTE